MAFSNLNDVLIQGAPDTNWANFTSFYGTNLANYPGNNVLGASVFGSAQLTLGGNDRVYLLRNGDLAGFGLNGGLDTNTGNDIVVNSFNVSGLFLLGAGHDLFVANGNNSSAGLEVDGEENNDIFYVTTSAALYIGGIGNDVMVSDGSDNTFRGGDGVDTYSAELATQGATIDLQFSDTPAGHGGAFSRFSLRPEDIFNVENVRGSRFGDEIVGNDGNNRLDGLAGNDVMGGEGGNDTIDGGTGTNTLFGDANTDTLVINGTVSTKSGVAGDFTVTGVLGGVAFAHIAEGFEQVRLNGVMMSSARFLSASAANTFNAALFIAETNVIPTVKSMILGQTINGTSAGATHTGTAGFDEIFGLGGNDTLRGLVGNDILDGGTGDDTLEGGDQNDVLRGQAGDDTLRGGNGNDQLTGGLDNDTLTGGANNDIFFFTVAFTAANQDGITDYNVAQDSIRIDNAFATGLVTGALAATAFKNTGLAGALGQIDTTDRIIYNSSTGQLLFDTNGSGAGGSSVIATMSTGLAMTAAEFLIF